MKLKEGITLLIYIFRKLALIHEYLSSIELEFDYYGSIANLIYITYIRVINAIFKWYKKGFFVN